MSENFTYWEASHSSERIEKWRFVKRYLSRYGDDVARQYFGVHEKLFFEGQVSAGQTSQEYFGRPGLPFFMVWYFPGDFQDITTETMLDYFSAPTLQSCRDFLMHALMEKFDPDYGFCDGREKLLARVLWPLSDPNINLRAKALKETAMPGDFPACAIAQHTVAVAVTHTNQLFGGDKSAHRYAVGQYLWQHAGALLDKNDGPYSSLIAKYLLKVIEALRSPEKLVQADCGESWRIELADSLRARIEAGELGVYLQRMLRGEE